MLLDFFRHKDFQRDQQKYRELQPNEIHRARRYNS